MESGGNGKGQVRVEQFQFYKKSYFVCCLVRGFAEEEKIVIEARRQQLAPMMAKQEQKERAARKRKADQIETNKQTTAPECPVRLLKNKLLLKNY